MVLLRNFLEQKKNLIVKITLILYTIYAKHFHKEKNFDAFIRFQSFSR
jgi:hypothetical protein